MPDAYGILLCQCGGRATVACSRHCTHPAFETIEQSAARKALFRPPRQTSNGGGANPRRQGTMSTRVYQPKVCACGKRFTPTGPRALRCLECRRENP